MTELILDLDRKQLYYADPRKEQRFSDLFCGTPTPYRCYPRGEVPTDPLHERTGLETPERTGR